MPAPGSPVAVSAPGDVDGQNAKRPDFLHGSRLNAIAFPDFVERSKCSQGAERRATALPEATRLVNTVMFATRRVVNGIDRNFEGVFANSAGVVNANREPRRVFFWYFSFAGAIICLWGCCL